MQILYRWSLLIAVVLVCSWQSIAMPISVVGTSEIHDNNKEKAREEALRNALWQIAQQTNTTLTAQSTMANGVIADTDVHITNYRQLRDFSITSEQQVDNVLHLSVTANPILEDVACQQPGKFNLVVANIHVVDSNHLKTNQITQLPNVIQQNIGQNLDDTYPVRLSESLILSAKDATALAQRENAHFVLALSLDNAMANFTFPSRYAFWEKQEATRQLAIAATLYDGFTGAIVWQRGLAFTAKWPWQYHETVSLASSKFMTSQYAELLNDTLSQISFAIKNTIECTPLSTRITLSKGNTLFIAHGRQQGILPGQIFIEPQSQTELVVSKVEYNKSELISSAEISMLNIQPNTVVVRKQ